MRQYDVGLRTSSGNGTQVGISPLFFNKVDGVIHLKLESGGVADRRPFPLWCIGSTDASLHLTVPLLSGGLFCLRTPHQTLAAIVFEWIQIDSLLPGDTPKKRGAIRVTRRHSSTATFGGLCECYWKIRTLGKSTR